MSIAIVYDGSIRDSGTPFYLRFAAVQHFGHDLDWYTEDPSAEKGGITPGHDFYIHVDDGRDDFDCTNIPHPWGYWAVDSHLGPDIRIAKAKLADVVWCAQKPFVEVLAKHGVKARWLPLACEPLLHPTAEELAARENREVTIPDKDLVFVGHLQSPKMTDRVEFLHRLFKARPNSWLAYGVFHEDMARIYHRGRLGVNHAVRDDLNMWFFELASMEVPQLAPEYMQGLEEIGVRPGIEFASYTNVDDAQDAAEMILNAPQASRFMARRALLWVREGHTYHKRLCIMLKDIESFLRGTPTCPSEPDSPPEGLQPL